MHLTKPTCHRLTECFLAPGELSSYWPSVALPNVGPTVNQRWADVFCEVIEVFSHLMFFDISGVILSL